VTVSRAYLAQRLRRAEPRGRLADALDPGGAGDPPALREGPRARLTLSELDAAVERYAALGLGPTPREAFALDRLRCVLGAPPLWTAETPAVEPPPATTPASEIRESEWSIPFANGTAGAPRLSADGSQLFQLDARAGLQVLARDSGEVQWSLPLCSSQHEYFQTPAVSPDGSSLFAAGGTGYRDAFIVAVDLDDRSVRWSQRLDGGQQLCPPQLTPDGKTLLVTTPGSQRLRAFDADTGDQRWELPLNGVRTHFPQPMAFSPDGGTAYCPLMAPMGDAKLLAVDVATGAEKWNVSHGSGVNVSGAVISGDGKTLFYARYNGLTAVDTATGEVRWNTFVRIHENVAHAPVLSPDGATVALAGERGLYVLDAATGAQRHLVESERFNVPAFIEGGAALLVQDRLGRFCRVDAANGARTPVLDFPSNELTSEFLLAPGDRWAYAVQGGALKSIDLQKAAHP
jgi:outer membrane protein assembly factor BamB